MAMGRQTGQQQAEFWIAQGDLPTSPGHPFYLKLNQLLADSDFDSFAENLCEPYYAEAGRPSIPPGRYFRMLLVGYFEGISSQRGIAWRCRDSLSLREFLKLPLKESSPDHSSMTRVRQRLPLEMYHEVFLFVLAIANERGLLQGKTVAVDSTTLEANAAMKSIVRRDTDEDWKAYIRRLMEEEGAIEPGEEPNDEDLRRFDKRRKNKRVSNDSWHSPVDEDARIAKMKDGRTHLAYKAEHVVDLDTDVLVSAEVFPADRADVDTLADSVRQADLNIEHVTGDASIQDVVADKNYHKAEMLAAFEQEAVYRTYIPEPRYAHGRRWTDKPSSHQKAVYKNRRRASGRRGKRLQKLRSEKTERSFAHVCETGGARRSWLRGLEKNNKRYMIACAARNLGLILRAMFGIGTPRGLQGLAGLFGFIQIAIRRLSWHQKATYVSSRAQKNAFRKWAPIWSTAT